ncbi:MAG TPA: preprotein translocase subunit SecG [Stellaceae bacterium]|nr:preprotein translocase subunit SecG [Stellaceae bacterium]
MITVILVAHLMLAISLVGVVLLQKSEGGALGMGGGGMSGFMSGRSTANLLTRTTAVVAACFFATSIALAVLAAHQRAPTSVVDQPGTAAPQSTPTPQPAIPAVPQAPSAPLAK